MYLTTIILMELINFWWILAAYFQELGVQIKSDSYNHEINVEVKALLIVTWNLDYYLKNNNVISAKILVSFF